MYQEKNFSNKITIINFLLTLVICIYHFPLWEYGYSETFNKFKEFFGQIAMALFFAISGYLLYQNANTKEDVKIKMKKRTFSLLVPYFIWNIVSMIKNIIVSKSFYFSFGTLLYGFFLGPANGPIWYLLALYFLMFLAPLVIKFKNNKKLVTISLVVIMIYFHLKCLQIIPIFFYAETWWWYYNMVGYLPYYLIGAYVGLYYKDLVSSNKNSLIVSLTALCVFATSITIQYFTSWRILHPLTNIIIPISFFMSMPNILFKRNLKPITSNAFFMYVMHVPILAPLANKLIKLVFHGEIGLCHQMILLSIVAILLMYFICCLIVTILKLILFKCDNIFNLLSGNRLQNDFSAYLRTKKKVCVSSPNISTRQKHD